MRRRALVTGVFRHGVGSRIAQGTAWLKRSGRSVASAGSKTPFDDPKRRCNYLVPGVQVRVLRAMRPARGWEEHPVALTEIPQTLGDLPVPADLPPALRPGKEDVALLASHGAKRFEPVPVVAAEVVQRGHPFVAVDLQNENTGVLASNENPIRPRIHRTPDLLLIVRRLEEIRAPPDKEPAGRNGKDLPVALQGGAMDFDGNLADIAQFVVRKAVECFHGAHSLLMRFDESFS